MSALAAQADLFVYVNSLSKDELKDLVNNLLTEHFGWAPEEFARQGFESVNNAMYLVTEELEKMLENNKELDPKEIQKGIYRVESYLENQIDKHFDLFEIYVLRNTFSVPKDYLPYISLKHQTGIDATLRDEDGAAMNEYEEELRLYEEELEKERHLALVSQCLLNKKADVEQRTRIFENVLNKDLLQPKSEAVVPLIMETMTKLHDLTSQDGSSEQQLVRRKSSSYPWSGTNFINWAVDMQMRH